MLATGGCVTAVVWQRRQWLMAKASNVESQHPHTSNVCRRWLAVSLRTLQHAAAWPARYCASHVEAEEPVSQSAHMLGNCMSALV